MRPFRAEIPGLIGDQALETQRRYRPGYAKSPRRALEERPCSGLPGWHSTSARHPFAPRGEGNKIRGEERRKARPGRKRGTRKPSPGAEPLAGTVMRARHRIERNTCNRLPCFTLPGVKQLRNPRRRVASYCQGLADRGPRYPQISQHVKLGLSLSPRRGEHRLTAKDESSSTGAGRTSETGSLTDRAGGLAKARKSRKAPRHCLWRVDAEMRRMA